MLEEFRRLRSEEKFGLALLALVLGPRVLKIAEHLVFTIVSVILAILIIVFCLVMGFING
jgi:hypothetical protein